MKLVKEYANSPEGKKKIKDEYGLIYEEKIDKKKLREYGEQMKEILFKHISPVIDSISIDDIIVGDLEDTKEGWKMQISFNEDNLRRESLYLDEYYGDNELQNIVLLFAKGYHARDYVYGFWTKPGQSVSIAQDRIRSRKDRDPNPFLNNAVAEFNQKTDGYATAILDEKYKNEDSEEP